MSETSKPAREILDLSKSRRDLCLFVVAGEHSGDALGGKLMQALNTMRPGRIRYLGVGGPSMEAQGLSSQYPLSEVAVMGIGAILKRLPSLIKRVNQTAAAAIAARPDAVVIIDSPELTHPIARRIRRRAPATPIIDYVSPSVWAWRSGRAAKMRGYIDHVLALLPFEPAAHERLGGPRCSYVGHPLIERLDWLAALDPLPLASRLKLPPANLVLVVLPGSRRSEVERLMQPFGDAVRRVYSAGVVPSVVIPVVDHVRDVIDKGSADWPVTPYFVSGDLDKWRAFKLARAALAASGTVTLELALAGAPMVVGYKVEPVMAPFLRRMIKAPTIILPNLVLGDLVFKEYCQEECTGERLGDALIELMADGPARRAQLEALARVPAAMRLPAGTPSEAAARIVAGACGKVAVTGGAGIALSIALLIAARAPPAFAQIEDEGGGRRLVLQCSRGETAVCRALAGNPRLAPGTREAIAELLADIEKGIADCDAGSREACRALVERYPSLPAAVRDAARQKAGNVGD